MNQELLALISKIAPKRSEKKRSVMISISIILKVINLQMTKSIKEAYKMSNLWHI
jgi:hypothetical protein